MPTFHFLYTTEHPGRLEAENTEAAQAMLKPFVTAQHGKIVYIKREDVLIQELQDAQAEAERLAAQPAKHPVRSSRPDPNEPPPPSYA